MLIILNAPCSDDDSVVVVAVVDLEDDDDVDNIECALF